MLHSNSRWLSREVVRLSQLCLYQESRNFLSLFDLDVDDLFDSDKSNEENISFLEFMKVVN